MQRLPSGLAAGACRLSLGQKNTPLRSRPIWAKLTAVVAEDTNLKPCPVLASVWTVSRMLAEVSKKSPENWFTESLNPRTLRVTPLQSMSRESITALTGFPRGRVGVRLFSTVKVSSTEQMFLTCSSAVPPSKFALAPPSGIGTTHNTSVGEIPGSYECKPNGLAANWLSIHINAKAPRCVFPSAATNSPLMKRTSASNP